MTDDKKQYIKNIAREDWESGHPFSSDDFRYFKRCCKDDGYDMTPEDFNYYWECFDDCRAHNDGEDNEPYYSESNNIEDDPMDFKLAPWYRKQLMGPEEWDQYCFEHNPEDEYMSAHPEMEYLDGKRNPYYKSSLSESYYDDGDNSMSIYWQAGYSAFYSDMSEDECPFEGEAAEEWKTGFDYAYREDIDISDGSEVKNSNDFIDEDDDIIEKMQPPEFYDPYDGINEDELLLEAAGEKNARRRVWGSDWNAEHTGASNLDFFGEYLLDEIKANLENITCTVGGKTKMAIDMSRTDISIDKDPAPGETVKERRIRAWVYFKHSFNVTQEDRQILKQKVIQAFQGGKADFNDKYKSTHLVIRDFVSIPTSFKYSTDDKSMYFVFKATQENYSGEKPKFIVHKQAKESHVQFKCPICGEDVWTDEGRVPVMINGEKTDVHEYHCTEESLEKYYAYCDKFWSEHDDSGPGYYRAMEYFNPPICELIKSNSQNIFESIIKEEIPF